MVLMLGLLSFDVVGDHSFVKGIVTKPEVLGGEAKLTKS